jgi:hypothetical protein
MDAAGNIIGRHVDFQIIKRFQELDPRYSIKKFEKLEKRFNIPTVAKPPKTTVRKVETKTFIALHDGNE